MGRGKFKGKPTVHRQFSSTEQMKEIEKQRAHERFMRLEEQGKTDQSKKDLDRLTRIREQRAEAAKKREEEKAAKEQKKAEARK